MTTAALHPTLQRVTERIVERSRTTRATYLDTVARNRKPGPYRQALGCANLAHAWAAMPGEDKLRLREMRVPNLAIITAYNDMLSAHQPYEHYPPMLREAARRRGATAQVAAGVPAMCDGVTQGYEGMELSLFSRDTIALATAVGLSHAMFDGVLLLGICDKIVPGLLMGALAFGHLPAVFVPSGPMPSGLSNADKSRIRQQYAEGKVGRDALLAAEEAAYHGPGTCTFYGTANSNQMLLELMGLQLPGSSFVPPGTPLRSALTEAAVEQVLRLHQQGHTLASMVDERAIVNAMVGLLATGGSTNHTIHWVAVARSAGILIDWDDFAELSAVVPLLARVYPNGSADVNQFHAAGGLGFVVRELLDAGLLHEDVLTIAAEGLRAYTRAPELRDGQLHWAAVPADSGDETILRPASRPFAPDGGLKCLRGNLGRAVVKTSAVKPEHWYVRAPARVFHEQSELIAAHQRGELQRDFVAVVRFQGPRANGMPELHKLTPILGALQDQGFRVALVTDGRMSGASGKVPAAIHVSPEAADGGPLARVRDGDLIELDCRSGTLNALVDAAEWQARPTAAWDGGTHAGGCGRELFALFRAHATPAEAGASALQSVWPQSFPSSTTAP
ncbi:phosphogluconate dehydratase [Tepidimonas taiwanensis]|uniref:Phosphogluconate dehydratase n=1 Tax=Tepidimonas taiwanensis TaxID=307486 RepID=A0A554XA21_9BURK|nr:phosphogluconate dehydratase [Tepidimonas taiwanensis]MCX7693071.1 phosphogluconate dehydratase [Tepidimonas taiwanensis]TSE32658.1 Phosphogluconate dehydratase [Tepidimonas taiwanensis]UBQ05399.1 phosphogluconate dehydratase [Tepidimonas taiwanensis]